MAIGAVGAAASGQTTQATKSLSGNFDTFLKLLTTQLQNQDPLEPLDATKFTEQLVSYSQVEQQIHTNANLESLIAMTKAAASSTVVGYLGKTALTTGPVSSLDGGNAGWRYALPSDAVSVSLVVSDANGKVVRTVPGEKTTGTHEFTWDGKDATGTTLPAGNYSLSVVARGPDNAALSSTIFGMGLVRELDMSAVEPLALVGSRAVKMQEIVGLKN